MPDMDGLETTKLIRKKISTTMSTRALCRIVFAPRLLVPTRVGLLQNIIDLDVAKLVIYII